MGSRNGKKCANINGTRTDEKEEEKEVGMGGIEHAPSSPLLYIGSSTGFSNRSDLHTLYIQAVRRKQAVTKS